MPAERDLFGLVDDPHAAPADLADDAIVAQLFDVGDCYRSILIRVDRLVGQGDVFHHRHRREDLADLGGEVRMAVDIILERRPFARAVSVEELLGQFQHQARPRSGFRRRHCRPPVRD